jgi:hypothetical protein
MSTRCIVLVNVSSSPIPAAEVSAVAQALQTQVDRDFGSL